MYAPLVIQQTKDPDCPVSPGYATTSRNSRIDITSQMEAATKVGRSYRDVIKHMEFPNHLPISMGPMLGNSSDYITSLITETKIYCPANLIQLFDNDILFVH